MFLRSFFPPIIDVSIQSSTNVRKMLRQITQKLWAIKTWDLDKLFIYWSFITFHFLGFFHWTVCNIFFAAVFIAWQWKLPKEGWKEPGNTKIVVKFDVNRKRCGEEKRLAFGKCFTGASLKGIQSKMSNFRWIWASLKAKTAKDPIRYEPEIMQIGSTDRGP